MHETTLATEIIYEGRIVTLEVLDVSLASGRRSKREIIRHAGAVVILPECPDGRFVFVKQYRKPLDCELVEAVAGTLERGEEPLDCAKRELREETGYTASKLTPLGTIVAAPGYSDERLHVFHARVIGEPEALDLDEDEVIEVLILTIDEVEECIAAGQLEDAKTLAAWLLYRSRFSRVQDEAIS